MNTAEKILGALEAERIATGYYLKTGAVVATTTVAQPNFASVDASVAGVPMSVELNFHQTPEGAEVVA